MSNAICTSHPQGQHWDKNKPEADYYLWLKDSAYLYLNTYERIQATESRAKIHNCSIT